MAETIFEPPFDHTPLTRRQLLLATVAVMSVAVAGQLQQPGTHRDPPSCEPLGNPFSSEFSADFGPGVGAQCDTADLAPTLLNLRAKGPKIRFQTTPPFVGIDPPG